MTMTTPNEFLQFAHDMGLGRMKTARQSSSSSSSMSTHTASSMTGLSVLNNLCRLIEQMHQLRADNDRLRAQLELVARVDKFQEQYGGHEHVFSSIPTHDEDKPTTLSPSNSWKIKHLPSSRAHRGGLDIGSHHDESAMDHDPTEGGHQHYSGSSAAVSWHKWSKVRDALRLSLRRKPDSASSPPLIHVDKPIPMISISVESDDEHLPDRRNSKKAKKKTTLVHHETSSTLVDEDSDQDDESIPLVRGQQRKRVDGHDAGNSSSAERQEPSTGNPPYQSAAGNDDDPLLTRKQSKIARYRRKLRSKLDTVKKQFSDQNSPATSRAFHGSALDDIGNGVNHALLTAQLAPALTKSYQQKMREWQTMQKSHFLVNYRRQSLTPKLDMSHESRKTSLNSTKNETPADASSSANNDPHARGVDDSHLFLEHDTVSPETTGATPLSPVLSPHQRSLIVHQWRQIMSEEINLRHYNHYLEQQMLLLKELESDLKELKTRIFCTNNEDHAIRQRSLTNLEPIQSEDRSNLGQRCRSLQSFASMPASWILAVQSAAYSDVLDGTSSKTTERAILFNKPFFDQLEHFKQEQQRFQADCIHDLQSLNRSKTSSAPQPNHDRSTQCQHPFILNRACMHKSSADYPQHFHPDAMIPLQTSTNVDHPTTVFNMDNHLDKRAKRSRFDLKGTFQRSRSMYISQINSWLQRRRRQQQSSISRRKSTTEPDPSESHVTTPKLLGSPRLARLHQRLFKQQPPPSPSVQHHAADDSDHRFQCELPVRIYLPPLSSPLSRPKHHAGIHPIRPSNDDPDRSTDPSSAQATPMLTRKEPSTAKERRESFVLMSPMFNNRRS